MAVGPGTVDVHALQLGRLLGACYLGFVVLAWVARGIRDAGARRGIVLSLFVTTFLTLVLFLKETLLDGATSVPNWFNIVMMAFFAVGFGYFYFTRRD